MKKLFTSLVAVFCTMAGMAQTLTFSHDGGCHRKRFDILFTGCE